MRCEDRTHAVPGSRLYKRKCPHTFDPRQSSPSLMLSNARMRLPSVPIYGECDVHTVVHCRNGMHSNVTPENCKYACGWVRLRSHLMQTRLTLCRTFVARNAPSLRLRRRHPASRLRCLETARRIADTTEACTGTLKYC